MKSPQDPAHMSASQIAEAVSSGTLSAQEVAHAHIERISKKDPEIKAFVTVLADAALEQAKAVDAKRASKRKLGRLAGVPVALKDNILLEGVETTCSSKILKGYRAPYDAHV